jgi:very-short-patch-repair endonuclease
MFVEGICLIATILVYLGNNDEEKDKEIGLMLNKLRPIVRLNEKDEKKVCKSLFRMKIPKIGNSFKDRCHERAKSWNKRNICSPERINYCSSALFIFDCKNCNHEFIATPANVYNKRWCPYCSKHASKLCKSNDCYHCYNKSFASYFRSEEWNYVKNNNKSPRQICKNSKEECWFSCKVCKHNIKMILCDVSSGHWCPYCSIPTKKLCEDNNCEHCLKRSFKSHQKSNCWDYYMNDITPRQVTLHSNVPYWLICNICEHSFEIMPCDICNDRWCPYCSHKKLCEDEKWCEMCYENSFDCHPKSECWSKKNEERQRQVFLHSNKKYLFDCDTCGKEFLSSPNKIAYGNWCPFCKNKTEAKIYDWLKKYFKVERQKTFKGCENERPLRFDFYLSDYNIIIECDGIQHFKEIEYWNMDLSERQKRDKFKEDFLLQNKIAIIRIFQEDVWHDRIDWKNELKKHIELHNTGEVIRIGKIYYD